MARRAERSTPWPAVSANDLYSYPHKGFKVSLPSRPGWEVSITIERDETADPPWDRGDGHGSVSGWKHRNAKRPGERSLGYTDRDATQRYYDWQGAVQKAKDEGWGLPATFNVEAMSKGQIAEAAVQLDYDYMDQWCRDEWEYLFIEVTVQTPAGKFSACISGVESWRGPDGKSDYLRDVVAEQIDEACDEASQWLQCHTCKGEGKLPTNGVAQSAEEAAVNEACAWLHRQGITEARVLGPDPAFARDTTCLVVGTVTIGNFGAEWRQWALMMMLTLWEQQKAQLAASDPFA